MKFHTFVVSVLEASFISSYRRNRSIMIRQSYAVLNATTLRFNVVKC